MQVPVGQVRFGHLNVPLASWKSQPLLKHCFPCFLVFLLAWFLLDNVLEKEDIQLLYLMMGRLRLFGL
jgi:hypothetical protein